MSGRGIAFYDHKENGREIIVAFGGFQIPNEFKKLCDSYESRLNELAARHFLSTYTQGPRIDEEHVTFSRAPDGRARFDTDTYRKTLGPVGNKNHKIEVLFMTFPETVARWLSDKPLYEEGMGDRFRDSVTRIHGGLPIGVCTAWDEKTGIYLVNILQEEGIITPEEIRTARRHKGFMKDVDIDDLVMRPQPR